MASVGDVLTDAFGRVREDVHDVVSGLTEEQLATPVADGANTVAWLVWHLTRIMDDHVAELQGVEQVWADAGWSERFGLPFPAEATGYGQSFAEVTAVRVPGELLRGYHDQVQDMVVAAVRSVSGEALDRIVDRRWDPPVTMGVRLVSVLNDATQHVGQAAYVAGILRRSTTG